MNELFLLSSGAVTISCISVLLKEPSVLDDGHVSDLLSYNSGSGNRAVQKLTHFVRASHTMADSLVHKWFHLEKPNLGRQGSLLRKRRDPWAETKLLMRNQ